MILLNGQPINVTTFPDKTSQVWKLPEEILKESNYAHITWQFESEAEFIHLAQLKMLLDMEGSFKCTLRIKYLPYARQDKEISNNMTFALRPFARLLNSLEFDEVIIHDPHSEKAIEMINNSIAKYPWEHVNKAWHQTESNVICYPDKGALEKYSKIYDFMYIWGEKVREQSSGKILNYSVIDAHMIRDQNVLIVDDICDGGATFILLAKELYVKGAKEVNLFVTHGLFTNGVKPLLDSGIKRIFTANGEVTVIA